MKREFAFQWHITDLCNLRCKHCYQERFDRERELPIEEVKRIIWDIVRSLEEVGFYGLNINLTGGEPLISPLLFPILEELEKSSFVKEVNIITNGIFLKNLYSKIKSSRKVRYIKVSLEGAREETNDKIRGKGNFKKVLENINSLNITHHVSPDIIFMFTLAKYNYREVDEMYKLAKKKKAKGLILERFIPLGEGTKIKEMVLSNFEWYEVIEKIAEWEEVEPQDLFPYKAFYIDFENNVTLGALCNLGESCALVPNGDIYPCRRLPLTLGNIRKESFKDIYERLKLFREQFTKENLKGKCHLCPVEDCIGCRALSYAFSLDVFEEDFQCWKI